MNPNGDEKEQQARTEDPDNAQKPIKNAGKKEISLPFWRVMLSVVQAAFGVQNRSNKERDFSHGKLLPFIVAALLFTLAFIGCLVFVVKLVLSTD